jgi:hypothetical protein
LRKRESRTNTGFVGIAASLCKYKYRVWKKKYEQRKRENACTEGSLAEERIV